jgi:hypothetical protein
MAQVRSKRQRPLNLEALEGRLTLSSGIGTAVAAHQAGLAHVSQMQKTVKASFTGRVQVAGTLLTTNNLKGNIGPDHFTGTGHVTNVNNHYENGSVNLHNSKGTIDFALIPGSYIKVGKTMQQQVNLLVVGATGKYASYLGLTGTVTKWNVPAKQNATAVLRGTFEP